MARNPEHPVKISILILAAGGASRMRGVDKLLENIEGIPLLTRVANNCLASNATQVIAVIRKDDDARRARLPSHVDIATNPDWKQGMATSFSAGLHEVAQEAQAVMIVLADMPDISCKDINTLIDAFDPKSENCIYQATSNTTPGHPVLFGRRYFSDLSALTGDNGARAVLRANPNAVTFVTIKGENALIDLDTPEDWVAFRNR